MHGLDISVYQNGINLSNVPGDFAIVKATEGLGYINPAMNSQINNIGNKVLGLYHFASGNNPISEARFFVSTIKPYLSNAFLVLDFEATAVNLWGVSGAVKFLKYVESETGKLPVIYMGLSDENRLDWSSAVHYPLWVAQYNNYNAVYGYQPRSLYGSLRNWNKWTIFQYTSNGYLQGWNKGLDLDFAENFFAKLTSNKDDGDDEMTWHPLVDYNTEAIVKINNTNGAQLYKDSGLTTQINRTLDYGSEWNAGTITNGAINLGGNQWINSADALYKANDLAFSDKASATGQVIANNTYTQNELTGGASGIKYLPLNSKWHILGKKDGYLIVGNQKTGMYVSANKMKIVL